jgi:hypothetical protein
MITTVIFSDKKSDKRKNKIRKTKKYENIDFGMNDLWSIYKEQCFEYKPEGSQYRYKVCPFDSVTQG